MPASINKSTKFYRHEKSKIYVPSSGGAVATDIFTGTNGTTLTAHSASWSNGVGSFRIESNELGCNASGDCFSYWNANSFNNDQYSQAVVGAIVAATYIGVCIRASNAAETYYAVTADTNDYYFFKYVAGTYTELGTGASTWTTGKIIRIEAQGTTIRYKLDGATIASVTDSSISSGRAGVAGAGALGTSHIDNWEGGNL